MSPTTDLTNNNINKNEEFTPEFIEFYKELTNGASIYDELDSEADARVKAYNEKKKGNIEQIRRNTAMLKQQNEEMRELIRYRREQWALQDEQWKREEEEFERQQEEFSRQQQQFFRYMVDRMAEQEEIPEGEQRMWS